MEKKDRRLLEAGGAAYGAGFAGVLAPPVANRAKGTLVRRQMNRKLGTLGGLTAEGAPVSPGDLPRHNGGKVPGGRRPSPRVAAAMRYQDAAKPYLSRLARPAIGGGKARALQLGGTALGLSGVAATEVGLARHSSRKVRKALTSQDFVGISPFRGESVDPLQLSASSSIMANFMIGASGKRISKRQKKALKRGAYGFAGANQMLYSPLGTGMRVTG